MSTQPDSTPAATAEAPDKGVGCDALLAVFAIKAYGNYGGGMAIVAAVDEDEAKRLATGLDEMWHTRYHAPESIMRLPVEYRGPSAVLANYETGE